MAQFGVPHVYQEKVESLIETFRKTCNDQGIEAKIQLELLGNELRQVTDRKGDTRSILFSLYDLKCDLVVNGWKLMACDFHDDVICLDADVTQILAKASGCAYCGSKSKPLYLIRNEDTRDIVVVDNWCFKNRTGNEQILHRTKDFYVELNYLSQARNTKELGNRYYNIRKYMLYMAEVMNVFGYTPVTKSNCLTPSYEYAKNFYDLDEGGFTSNKERYDQIRSVMDSVNFNHESQEAKETVKEVMEWIYMPENSDVFKTLLPVLQSPAVMEDSLPLIAQAFGHYANNVGYAMDERKKPSNWVGHPRDVVRIHIRDVSFTPVVTKKNRPQVYSYTITDIMGNVFTFLSEKFFRKRKILEGVVQKHIIHKGEKRTILTRCKM